MTFLSGEELLDYDGLIPRLQMQESRRLSIWGKEVDFAAAYTSDMLREWCLGNMEAENNAVFIKSVADWLEGASFAEMNGRLPDVADASYKHDTTGVAEPFQTIEERLKAAFEDMAQRHRMERNSNILVVPHAFAIKTIFR